MLTADNLTEEPPALICHSAAASHTGHVRALNEDSFCENPGHGIWCVADGMGGHDAGEIASAMVADAIALIAAGPCLQASVEAISAAILQVNSQLSDALASGVHSRAMGTTVIAVAIADAECACLWAGDSRLYLYRNLGLYQMSSDHSIVQELLDQGVIEMDEVSSHPQRHIITRAVGVDPALELEMISFRLQSGDVLLLCSDGLYTELNADAIMQVLAQDGDCTHKAQALIEGVLEGRARDNVTVTVIEIGHT